MDKIISCLFSFSPQSNWHHVQAPEPEHYPGAAAELRGLSDAGGADCPAGKCSLLTPQSLVPAHAGFWGAHALATGCTSLLLCPAMVRWSFQIRRDRDIILVFFLLLATTPQTGRTIKESRFGLAPGSGPSSGQRLAMTSFLAESPGGRRHHMATDKERTLLLANLAFVTDPLRR